MSSRGTSVKAFQVSWCRP